ARLDYFGFGLSDRNSVAGVVRAHLAKRETELALRYHPGARLTFCDGTPDILAYLRDRAGWATVPAAHTRQPARGKRRLHSLSGRSARARSRPRADRDGADEPGNCSC